MTHIMKNKKIFQFQILLRTGGVKTVFTPSGSWRFLRKNFLKNLMVKKRDAICSHIRRLQTEHNFLTISCYWTFFVAHDLSPVFGSANSTCSTFPSSSRTTFLRILFVPRSATITLWYCSLSG